MNSSSTYARGSVASPPDAPPTGRQLFGGIAINGVAGVIAALMSALGTGNWYQSLRKPMWAPPKVLFAPIHIAVFVCTGVALAYLLASRTATPKSKNVVLGWFWTQLVLGVAWSYCFFMMHSASWSYVVVMLLWCAVVALLWTGSRLSKRAFWLLMPMFLWVTFSSSLTFAILSFNVLKQEVKKMDEDPRNQKAPKDPPIITGTK